MANKDEGQRVWNSTLRRRKKLEGGKPLKRSGWQRSKPPKDKAHFKHTAASTPKTRKPLAQVSKKHKRALVKDYFPAHSEFLRLPESRFCWICIGRSLSITRAEVRKIMLMPVHKGNHILLASGARFNEATEVHHWGGRIGRLLAFVPWFVPECRECREWPHACIKDARKLDLVAPATQYNVFPRETAEELWEEYKKNSSFQSKKDS